jgi:hypothetical protein
MRTIAFSFVCLLAVGCHHEVAPVQPPVISSYGTVWLNGNPIQIHSFVSSGPTSSRIYRNAYLYLGFWMNDDAAADEETNPLLSLYTGFIPVEADSVAILPGVEYPQDTFSMRGTYAIQYDGNDIEEPCNKYRGASGWNSWVKVRSYDSLAHRVCISFELHLAADAYDCPVLPDTLHFTKGEICLEVKPSLL